MRIVIIHYHFYPGGVTSAIRSSLLALKSSGKLEGKEVILLCGDRRGTDELQKVLESSGLNVEIAVHTPLFYRQEIWPDREEFEAEAQKLSDLILSYGKGNTIYWVHNPSLGKNPALTRALIIACERSDKEKQPYYFLYHVHDFPECGRPGNLSYLMNCYKGGGLDRLYPDTENVSFICINSSDRELLINCGVPEGRVFFLPNAINVNTEVRETNDRSKIVSALKGYADRQGYIFKPEMPWWLMPIRLIRRKNALEAFFLRLLDGDVQILITLDANSDPEYPYANAVKDAIRREAAPGMVGFGAELVGKDFSFDDLILASRAIVTTSLMEGFGFAFLEGPIRNRPVIGRNLPHVTKDFGGLGLPVDDLYDSFFVPVSAQERQDLHKRFREFATNYASMVNIERSALERYLEQLKHIYGNDAVDFGYLDLSTQLRLFSRLKDSGFEKTIRFMNDIEFKLSPIPSEFKEKVNSSFGYGAHAEKLTRIFDSIMQKKTEKVPADLTQRLKESFFEPRRNRPLFW